jgi:hypothetical protein
MRKCVECGKPKRPELFRGRRKKCRSCEVRIVNHRRRDRATASREVVFEYLRANPCTDCGETDISVLEFDHRDRALKELTVAELITQGYSLERVMREIAKCDVRCANCHRRRTAKQLGWYAALAAGKSK